MTYLNPQVPSIANFIRDNYEATWHWSDEQLFTYINWAISHAFLVTATSNGRIVGLVVAKPVMDPYDGLETAKFDNEGSCIFVDMAIAPTRLILKACGIGVLQRFGQRDKVALKHGDEIRVHSVANVRQALFQVMEKKE